MGAATSAARTIEPDDFTRQQCYDAAGACPDDFTDADLFAALFGGEHAQTQKTQTGDDDGECGKAVRQPAHRLLAVVELLVIFVGEIITEGEGRLQRAEDFLHRCHRLMLPARHRLHEDTAPVDIVGSIREEEDQRLDGVAQTAKVEVFDDADNGVSPAEEGDALADGVFEPHHVPDFSLMMRAPLSLG